MEGGQTERATSCVRRAAPSGSSGSPWKSCSSCWSVRKSPDLSRGPSSAALTKRAGPL